MKMITKQRGKKSEIVLILSWVSFFYKDYFNIVVGVAVNTFELHLSIFDIYPAGAQIFDIMSS